MVCRRNRPRPPRAPPHARPRPSAVSMSTGRSHRARRSRHTWWPSRPGNITSSSTRIWAISLRGDRRRPVAGPLCLQPMTLQVPADHIGEERVVVDNENPRRVVPRWANSTQGNNVFRSHRLIRRCTTSLCHAPRPPIGCLRRRGPAGAHLAPVTERRLRVLHHSLDTAASCAPREKPTAGQSFCQQVPVAYADTAGSAEGLVAGERRSAAHDGDVRGVMTYRVRALTGASADLTKL